MRSKRRILIVGGGFAGLTAARRLCRARRDDLEVVLVDRNNYHTFQPLLYQVATAGLEPAEVCPTIRSVLRDGCNCRVRLGELTAVDYRRRVAELDHGRSHLSYDYMVLAVGGQTGYFGHEQWAKHTLGMKTLADALAIRNRLIKAFEQAEVSSEREERQRLMTFVIVGGGPTGVELAGAVAELRRFVLPQDYQLIRPEEARVVLLEGGPRLLGQMPEHLSKYAMRRLSQLGVEVRLNERVTEISNGRVTTSVEELEAETVLWAAGVRGQDLASKLQSTGDVRPNQRLPIDPYLRLLGQERVYCLGDMAFLQSPTLNEGEPLPGLASVAMQQGRQAADNLLRQLDGKSLRRFSYRDKGTMATIGRSAAAAKLGKLRLTGFAAWVCWLAVHLYYLTGNQNRALVLLRWTWGYLTWRWGARVLFDARDIFKAFRQPQPSPNCPSPSASRQPASVGTELDGAQPCHR